MSTNRTIGSRELKIISLIISITGMVIIFISAKAYTPDYIEIKDIDASLQGQYILTCGTVTDTKETKNAVFITIVSKNRYINSIFFKKTITVKKGSEICIKGIVDIYNNNLEIIGKEIKKEKIS